MLKMTSRLKELILADEILIMPGAYDALSAKILEQLGFKAIQATGYGIAASMLGVPDIGLLSMGDMLDQTRRMVQAVGIPIMADGDTGFGNAVNTYYTVQSFEAIGCGGINLEDQVFPKRCGHMDNKQVISAEEMVSKVEAAVAAKKDKDFIINARTDSIAVYGVDEAIRRGNAYAKAGADLIFVEAPRDKKDIERVIKSIDAPVSINMADGGKTPSVSIDELQKWGAARVSVPIASIFSAAKGMVNALTVLRDRRETPSAVDPECMLSFKEFTDIVGLPFYLNLGKKYNA